MENQKLIALGVGLLVAVSLSAYHHYGKQFVAIAAQNTKRIPLHEAELALRRVARDRINGGRFGTAFYFILILLLLNGEGPFTRLFLGLCPIYVIADAVNIHLLHKTINALRWLANSATPASENNE